MKRYSILLAIVALMLSTTAAAVQLRVKDLATISDGGGHKLIGYYYLSKNDKVRAREYLSRSFELKPNQSDVALTLGQLGVEIKIPQKTDKDTKEDTRITEKQDII